MLISTHSLKATNPRAKSPGLISLKTALPGLLSNADAMQYSQLFWASPTSAADMPAAKALAEKANKAPAARVEQFPADLSYADKQLFMRVGDEWVLHTPALGGALADAVSTELKAAELGAGSTRITHQPTVAAWANHGGAVLKNHGKLLAINVGLNAMPGLTAHYKHSQSTPVQHEGRALMIEGEVQGFNANAGLISVGIPSITAIQGVVDKWCIDAGIASDGIEFAFGVKDYHWWSSDIKGTNGTKDFVGKAGVPMVNFSEKRGNARFRLILRGDVASLKKIRTVAKSTSWRIAGGDVFGVSVQLTAADVSQQQYRFIHQVGVYGYDPVKELVTMAQERTAFPVLVGYRLLEAPRARNGVRDGKTLHAFSEGVYLPCTFSFQPAFWGYRFDPDTKVGYSSQNTEGAWIEELVQERLAQNGEGVEHSAVFEAMRGKMSVSAA